MCLKKLDGSSVLALNLNTAFRKINKCITVDTLQIYNSKSSFPLIVGKVMIYSTHREKLGEGLTTLFSQPPD